MTLHKIKEVLVDEKQLLTSRQLTVLVIKTGLTVVSMTVDIGFLTFSLLGMAATVLVVFMAMFAFNWIFDMINEDEVSLKGVKLFSNLFILFIPILLGEFLVLKYFRFF